MRTRYGDVAVIRGKKHTDLGMELDYTVRGECKIEMEPYTMEIIDNFPKEIQGT